VTTIGLYDIGTSTTLESNKSQSSMLSVVVFVSCCLMHPILLSSFPFANTSPH